jgi:hypothetical protein
MPTALARRTMHIAFVLVLSFLSAFLSACAAAAPSGVPDAAIATECAEDHHRCGDTCVMQQPNDPAHGCTFGCGNPCPGMDEVGGPDGAVIATCTLDGQCAVRHPDSHEDNNSPTRATDLGNLDDAADSIVWLTQLSIDAQADEDWFRFHVTDGFDGGNPRIRIEVTVPGVHELAVWLRCDATNVASVVRCGERTVQRGQNTLADPLLGTGCAIDGTDLLWSEAIPSCAGIADAGTVMLRVRKTVPPWGEPYSLRVSVE